MDGVLHIYFEGTKKEYKIKDLILFHDGAISFRLKESGEMLDFARSDYSYFFIL